jgi:hypothetical protein
VRFKDGIGVKLDGDCRIVTLANKVAIAGHGALIFPDTMNSNRLLSRLNTYQRRRQQREHCGTPPDDGDAAKRRVAPRGH